MKSIKLTYVLTWIFLNLSLAEGVHAAQIVVGQVAPLSGSEALQGKDYAAGMRLLFDATNRSGGINGHTFKLVSEDDKSRAEESVRLTQKLLDTHHPVVLAGYFGNRGIAGLVSEGLLEREKIALVGYRAAGIFPNTPFLFNVRASLGDEINKMAEHFATIGINRLGLFYEDGPAAVAIVAATSEAAGKNNALLIAKVSYQPGTTRVADAVESIINAQPQAIILVSSGAAGGRFIEQYRAAGGTAQIFVHSGADMERFAKLIAQERLAFVSSVMRGVAIAQVVPNPYDASKLAKELNDAISKSDKSIYSTSYIMLEGYIAAKVIVEAVRRSGNRPTRESITNALEGIENLDLNGYVVGFKPNSRGGSKFVKLSIITETGKIRQ